MHSDGQLKQHYVGLMNSEAATGTEVSLWETLTVLQNRGGRYPSSWHLLTRCTRRLDHHQAVAVFQDWVKISKRIFNQQFSAAHLRGSTLNVQFFAGIPLKRMNISNSYQIRHSGTTSRTSTLSSLKTLARGLYRPQHTVKCVSAVCVCSGHFHMLSRTKRVIKGTRGPRLKNRTAPQHVSQLLWITFHR